MSKQEDLSFLKIQTCVLKVNIHCDGCKHKVKKLLQKIDGVYTTSVDSEQGKVTVTGNADPVTLIKKLAKNGKHAELLGLKGGSNNANAATAAKAQNVQGGGKKEQKGNNGNGNGNANGKAQKGGGGGKDPKVQPPQPQPPKGFKDLKLPFPKDPKTVKFALPPEDDGSDYDDDEFDDYDDDEDDDLEDMDGFDADFDDDFKTLKIKPANNGGKNAKKVEAPAQNGAKAAGGGGGANNGKNGGAICNNGNGGNNNAKNGGGGGGKNDLGMGPRPNPNMMTTMGQNFRGIGPPQAGNAPPVAAAHGLPVGAMPLPAAYFQNAMLPPAAAGNPYQQQQYMAAMQQQQQQRMMMMNGQDQMYQPMMMAAYPRPPPMQGLYAPPPHPQGEPYTNFFSDENTNSCSVM